jgi:hypothetical protein
MMKCTVLAGCALAVAAASLAGCGSSATSASDHATQNDATRYQIDLIERTFHRAMSTHDVNLMMGLFAPGAVFNLGLETFSGKAQIRKFFATHNAAFQPQNDWESDTPSYKIKVTVNGDKGTLYFECHFVDVKTGTVKSLVGVDENVQKIDGTWLIVQSAVATPVLSQ